MSHRSSFSMFFIVLLSTLWGAAPASAAFTDHGDGTVTDTDTGLMWDQCSWGQDYIPGPPPSCDPDPTSTNYTYPWSNALGLAVTANTDLHRGYDDWRLPNRTELESLVDITAVSPAIDSNAFPNTASLWYWSSTTYPFDPLNPEWAWYVSFQDGYSFATAQTLAYNVRLVRGGTPLNSFDLLAFVSVSVKATDNTATEADLTTGRYTFIRTGDTTADLTVNYKVTGTATAGSDYVALGTSVVIPAGETRVTKTLKPKQDNLQELPETVILTLKQSPNYAVGTPAKATVTITSDETVTQTVTVKATDNTATEADLTTGRYTFTRTGDTSAALTVNYKVTGTATAGSDYAALGTSVVIPAGKTRVNKTLTPKQDSLQESAETVILTLKQSPNYAVGTPARATVTLISDEVP